MVRLALHLLPPRMMGHGQPEVYEDNWEGLYGPWSLREKVKAQEALPVPRPLAR